MRKNLLSVLCALILSFYLSCKPAMSTSPEPVSNQTIYKGNSETDNLKLLKSKQKEILLAFSFSDSFDEGTGLEINSEHIKLYSDNGNFSLIKWSEIKKVKVVSSGAINEGVAIMTFADGKIKFIVLPLSLGLKYSKSTNHIVTAIENLAKINKARLLDFEMAPTTSGEDDIHFIISKGKWGAFDNEGNIVIGPNYDEISKFDEDGTAEVKSGKKYGRINKEGNLVVIPIYDFTSPNKEGRYMVRDKGKYGFLGDNSSSYVPTIYDYAIGPVDGVIKVSKDGRTFYIDKWNNELTNKEDWGIWKND